MNDILADSVYFGLAMSLGVYWLSVWISKKIKSSLVNPLLMTSVFIIIFLTIFRIDYEVFDNGAKYITYLLPPTTVCLAVPVYKNARVLKDNFMAIIAGILAGCIACAITIAGMCLLFKMDTVIYSSLLPKSITTAIAIGVSSEINGIVSITVLAVIVSGLSGAMFSGPIFKIFSIKNPIAQGLACGNAAHAIGTSKAFQLGEVQGAMSSLSIVIAGVLTVIIAPLMSNLIV